jgi:hypothetical protein
MCPLAATQKLVLETDEGTHRFSVALEEGAFAPLAGLVNLTELSLKGEVGC